MVVEEDDDVKCGAPPGGDGRDEDSEGLTLFEDKVGDWRVGDWTGPIKGEGQSAMMKKSGEFIERKDGNKPSDDSPPLATPIFPIPIIPIEPPKLFIPMPFIPYPPPIPSDPIGFKLPFKALE